MTNENKLFRLSDEFGQSPWLDNLKRDYITSGKLLDVRESGVRGLTSNPTIFQKAIQGSSDYDEQFALLARHKSPIDLYWDLVLQDIDGALKVFEPIFEDSRGRDGFVSVEVDPGLAHDGAATESAARQLHERVGRPNVMIKIPATLEGIGAIRAMIGEGRCVNVTLIFSLERYQMVMDAYIDGLELLAAKTTGSLSGVASVASFFISRIDSEIDRLLNLEGSPKALALRGTAAIAQAKLAYQQFLATFSGPRWAALANRGAQLQRPLWASTSTKNPDYPDTMYVDSLIGPDSVNTLPDNTLAAFADHGTLARTIDANVELAAAQWAALGTVGVDVAAVAQQLEREGVSSFRKSFEDLIAALTTKGAELSK